MCKENCIKTEDSFVRKMPFTRKLLLSGGNFLSTIDRLFIKFVSNFFNVIYSRTVNGVGKKVNFIVGKIIKMSE